MIFVLAAAAIASAHNASFRDRRESPVMVAVSAGKFLMGSDEAETRREGRPEASAATERPRREIGFDKPFAIGKYHVTRRQFGAFAKATKRPMDGCVVVVSGKWSDGRQDGFSYRRVGFAQRADEPALCVDWADAVAYANWLSVRTGHKYRLPTEAEWEYASRAGTTTARWWGDGREALCSHANGGDRDYAAVMPDDKTANLACSDGFVQTSPAARFPANAFGLHDVLGNAWQWVADCFTAVPGMPPPEGECKARSIRGGSWHNGPAVLRSATRFGLPPTMRSASLGFRVLRELP